MLKLEATSSKSSSFQDEAREEGSLPVPSSRAFWSSSLVLESSFTMGFFGRSANIADAVGIRGEDDTSECVSSD